jgi:hypothetical protein
MADLRFISYAGIIDEMAQLVPDGYTTIYRGVKGSLDRLEETV